MVLCALGHLLPQFIGQGCVFLLVSCWSPAAVSGRCIRKKASLSDRLLRGLLLLSRRFVSLLSQVSSPPTGAPSQLDSRFLPSTEHMWVEVIVYILKAMKLSHGPFKGKTCDELF